MDFSYIKSIVNAINSTSEIKFNVELSRYGNLDFTTIPNKACVQIGTSLEAILYIHLFGWRKIFHLYLAQNELAENGMYGFANMIISELMRELHSFKSLRMKLKSLQAPTQLNSLTLITLFHEFGHIAFSQSSLIREDYFNTVYRYIESNPIQEVTDMLKTMFANNGEKTTFKYGVEELSTIEEIASDYFAIDQIFKLNKVQNIGKEKVVDFCFAMINALTFSYRITAFKCYVKNIEHRLIFEKLPQFSYRRMLVFDRMRDVLFNEFDIDNEWFGSECEKISIEYDEIANSIPLCHDVYKLISQRDPFHKDQEKESYCRNIRLLNSNFSSNTYPI